MFIKKDNKNLKFSLITTFVFVLAVAAAYYVNNLIYSPKEILQKANEYYENEHYSMAIKYFSRVIPVNSNTDIDYITNYAMSLFKVNSFDLATKYFAIAAEMNPKDDKNYYYAALALYYKAVAIKNKKYFLQASDYLEKAINLNPIEEEYYLLIGLCFRSCELWENARVFYRKALFTSAFSTTGFHHLIGNSFAEEKRYKEALISYEKAKENDPWFAGNYCSIGNVYLKLGDEEAALSNYLKAIEVKSDYIAAFIDIANFYYDKNNFPESRDWSLKALKINPIDKEANFILAMSYKNIGQMEHYKEYIKKAMFFGSDKAVTEVRSNKINL
jgi:tetratricopeptide (TPR) repeat protein